MTDSTAAPARSERTEISTPRAVELDPTLNTTDLLRRRLEASPEAALFAVPEGEGWRDISTREFSADVDAIAKGLIAAGVAPGDRIAFIGKTCYEWSLVDFALWTAGAVMVPVYETSSSDQLKWILEDSGAMGLITQDPGHTELRAELGDEAPALQWEWTMHTGALDELRAAGAGVDDAALERARTAANADDVATLIYTSGTTGRPKGVVLTHANFVDLCQNIDVPGGPLEPVLHHREGASTLLFVTLAHVFARLISVLAVTAGVKVGHQPDTTQLVPSLGSFRPTFLLAVPRVFEKVYNSASQKASAGGKSKIFKKAVATGVAYSRAKDAGSVPFGLKLQYWLFDKLVFSKLRATLGGRVEHAVSGSAPLGLFLGHFYRALGVQVLEGYGLTETTAPVTVNLPDKFKIGTVGPALPGCAVRIAEDGEIETTGVNVFREYWNNPEATAKEFHDGWFGTGDLGSLDDDGYLTINGRKKEIIVTSSGKNVAPAVLEDPVRADVLVGECVVVGDGRKFIGALLTIDPEMAPKWFELHGLPADLPMAEAAEHPTVLEHLQRVIDRANKRVSRAESIRKFVVLDHHFSIDDGTLTPKLSIKRHVILDRYAADIDALYDGEGGNGGEPGA